MKKFSTVRQLLTGLGLTATISTGCGSSAQEIGNPPGPTPDTAVQVSTPDAGPDLPDAAEDRYFSRETVSTDNPPWTPPEDAGTDAGDASVDVRPDLLISNPPSWPDAAPDGKKD